MIDVAVVGAAGYTGQALLKILLAHPEVQVTVITSESQKGTALAAFSPSFVNSTPLVFEANDHTSIAGRCDVVFLCLPHTESMTVAPIYLSSQLKVFDLSADFRLSDAGVYADWYGTAHTAHDFLGEAVYGLPELHKGEVAAARLIACPGCYPTSAILALAPVIDANWLDRSSIVVNSSSGVSGAGATPKRDTMLTELEGNYYAYGAPNHRHTPEIEQELSALAGEQIKITFIPHLLPTARGIYTTITANVNGDMDRDRLTELYRAFYRDAAFVTVVEGFPRMSWAVLSNHIYIGVEIDSRTDRLIVTSTIDNLIKGASGQAVQNFNIAHGFDETVGL